MMKSIEDTEEVIARFFSDIDDVSSADNLIAVAGTMDFPTVYSLADLETHGLRFRGMLHDLYVFEYTGD